jgi:DNA-directed RNA polymerase subunit alpha
MSNIINHNDNSASLTIEPMYAGYGWTLGNSLRRVLLSTIEGAAVTSFRIKGASHEFSTVDGILEDVVNLMLNLKGVVFKLEQSESVTLSITKKGKGEVKGSDIKLTGGATVINPEHVICNITDDKTTLEMELNVSSGRGYRPVEEGRKDREVADFVALDALFSPVVRVRYKVENTRVGQATDLDKLIITIDTNGAISPTEAFEQACAVLAGHYVALSGSTKIETQSATVNHVSTLNAHTARMQEEEPTELMTSIEDLNLTARTTNALINNDIHTIKDLFSLSETELRELKGFGSKALDEVKEKMAELEL